MKNYRKHIDDFFREKLGNYREAPPAEAWSELEVRLDDLAPSVPGSSYRWLWHFAIVSLILFLSVSLGRKIIGGSTDDAQKNLALNEKVTSTAPQVLPANGTTTSNDKTAPENNNPASNNAGNNPGEKPGTGIPINNDQQESATPSKGAAKKNNNTVAAKQTGSNHSLATHSGKAKKGTGNTKTPQATNNYNSNLSNPAPEEVNDNNVFAASPSNILSASPKSKKEEETPGTFKKETKDKPQDKIADKNSTHKSKIGFNRFEAGVKMGYEGGFDAGAANKLVISPYLQYNLSPRLSVMLQPAIKAANTSSRNLGTPQSYYKTNEDGKIATDYITPNTKTVGGTIITINYFSEYTYTQTHDSIVKSYKTGGTYTEFELPILLKYALCKKLSVYGGVNLVYSKVTGITENTYNKKGIMRSMDVYDTTTLFPTAPPANVGITYNGTPFSNYTGPLYSAQQSSQFRIGYMLGFSYTCRERWLLDALVQQAPATSDVKGGYNLNTPLSSTYFRLSIGYKLIK